MMYYLKTHQKICLPNFLFYYLRDSMRKTRTTGIPNKNILNYIPFGRLLTGIFLESGLVKFLVEETHYRKDLAPTIREFFNASNLRYMGLIKKGSVNPLTVPLTPIIDRRIPTVNFHLLTGEIVQTTLLPM